VLHRNRSDIAAVHESGDGTRPTTSPTAAILSGAGGSTDHDLRSQVPACGTAFDHNGLGVPRKNRQVRWRLAVSVSNLDTTLVCSTKSRTTGLSVRFRSLKSAIGTGGIPRSICNALSDQGLA
jgi:hypothetical protein